MLQHSCAFGTTHRKACVDQLEKHVSTHAPWLLAAKNLRSRAVATPNPHEDMVFETHDGVLQGDPASPAQTHQGRSWLANCLGSPQTHHSQQVSACPKRTRSGGYCRICDDIQGACRSRNLAVIARLSALAALLDTERTHGLSDLEARLQPKMETPPREIVGKVHVLPPKRSVKPYPSTSPN